MWVYLKGCKRSHRTFGDSTLSQRVWTIPGMDVAILQGSGGVGGGAARQHAGAPPMGGIFPGPQ